MKLKSEIKFLDEHLKNILYELGCGDNSKRELFKQIMEHTDCILYTASSFEELNKLVEEIRLKVNGK